jgi:AraC-like DNA-binding protein
MLAAFGHYFPTILRTRQHWSTLTGEHLQGGIYRLIQVEDGEHRLQVAGRSYRCGPGTIYLLAPGQRESWKASARALAQMLAFTVTPCALRRGAGQTLTPIEQEQHQPLPQDIWGVDLPVVLDHELVPRLRGPLQFILGNSHIDAWSRYRATRQLADLLDFIVTHYRSGYRAAEDRGDPWLETVLQVINDDLARIPNATALAGILGLSPDHLARRFRAGFGESPAAYLRRVRLDQAEDLLRFGEWSIGMIAMHLGYRSHAAFDQAWRRRHELSPQQWRFHQRNS